MSAQNCGPSSDLHLHLRAAGEQPLLSRPLWLTINAQPAMLARLDWVKKTPHDRVPRSC